VGDGEAGATVYSVPEFTVGATPSAVPPVAQSAEPVESDAGNGSAGASPDALDPVDTEGGLSESAADTSDAAGNAALDEPEVGGAAAT
jgi:hypothetical protein